MASDSMGHQDKCKDGTRGNEEARKAAELAAEGQ